MPRVNIKSWQRATPIMRKDNIISSLARETGDVGFKPSYDNEGRPNLNHLLTDEYMRIWFKERDAILKEVHAKAEMQKTDNGLRRRFVQKMFTCRKKAEKEVPIIQIKKFQRATTTIDNRKPGDKKAKEEKKTGDKNSKEKKDSKKAVPCIRYKPECDKETKGGDGDDKNAEIFKDDDDKNDMSKSKKTDTVNGLQDPDTLVMNVLICPAPKPPKPFRANGLKCCCVQPTT